MLFDIEKEIEVPQPAPSYSSLGKTNDAANKQADRKPSGGGMRAKTPGAASSSASGSAASMLLGKKVKSKNWEGMDLIDNILTEVNRRHGKQNPRGEILLSSPRVSPAMVERDATENADHLMRHFVKDTAMKMGTLKEMPAAQVVTMSESRIPLDERPPVPVPNLDGTFASQNLSGLPGVLGSSPSPGLGSRAASPSLLAKNRIVKKGSRKKVATPTAAFLAPGRPHPGQELLNRAPSVGKYTPHYGVVERHLGGVTITKAGGHEGPGPKSFEGRSNSPNSGRSSPARAQSPVSDNGGNTFELTQAHTNTGRGGGTPNDWGGTGKAAKVGHTLSDTASEPGSPLDGSKKKTDGGKNGNKSNTSTQQLLDGSDYRKHQIRDVSSAFKSAGRREEPSSQVDADYWPFPQPGATTYQRGRMTPGTRITTADMRPGCGANTMYYVEDRYRPKSVVNFDRGVSRDQAASVLSQGNAPPQALEYNVNPDVLSTKPKRVKGYTNFKNQKGRPPVANPTLSANVEPLGLYHDSVATKKKNGYVNLARNTRVNKSTDDSIFEEPKDTKTVLNVDHSVRERRPASVSFSKAEKKSIMGTSRVDESEYHPNYASISRRRPVASMRGTSRDTPVLREGVTTQRETERQLDIDRYDRARHVASPTMGSQLSRDARNKILSPPLNAADVVYDIPAPKAKTITFSRLKRQ